MVLSSHRPESSKDRLLIATPYSPLEAHGHAADDIALSSIKALAAKFEVHVYAPGQRETVEIRYDENPVTYHRASPARPSVARLFGLYPAALRKDWRRVNTREFLELSRLLDVSHVHVEYLQPAEVGRSLSGSWSITLHDVTTRIWYEKVKQASGVSRLYRWFEYYRVRPVERAAITRASHVFALSPRDVETIGAMNRNSSRLRLGTTIPQRQWDTSQLPKAVFVFAGAMWRTPNNLMALSLIQEVMPLVRKSLPRAQLRIVGIGAPAWLEELSGRNGISIVGRVESIEEEYFSASAVLAPSLVDAGILMKALRGLACGSPLVVNSTAAEPVGLVDGVNARIADGSEEIAAALVALIADAESAAAIGQAGRDTVSARFTWANYADDFVEGLAR
ncbi:MAG: glycosyltransferase [Frondihabitans sp.]|nr:glycosyltransferase [Frondihabitans sp.]